jgi:2-polyprenyl-6-methoxyphenol hydroxylase-like FAD-dependent oxidoreductase
MRPVLHRIMQDRVRELEIPVRIGLTVSSLKNADSKVDVTFSDGTTGQYDIVIGSDGVSSSVRELAFPHMRPALPTGQGCWRISIRKPPEQDMGEFYFGSANPCGITICGDDAVYLFLLTPHEPREEHLNDDELYTTMKAHLAPFGGNAGWIRDNMTRDNWINYRPLTAALQPGPWHNGRIVLLGDAVHATTPHLASGAGMAVESAIVLAEELERASSVEAGLQAYQDRRFDRCRDVIESSIAIGKLQLEHGPPGQIAGLIEGALARLNAPF